MKEKTRGSGVRHFFGFILILFGIAAIGYSVIAMTYIGGNKVFGDELAPLFEPNNLLSAENINTLVIVELVLGIGLFVVGLFFVLTNDKTAKQGNISSFDDMTEVQQTSWNLAATEENELSSKAKNTKEKTRGSGVRHFFGFILILFGIAAIGYSVIAMMYIGGNKVFGDELAPLFEPNNLLTADNINTLVIVELVLGIGLFVAGWFFALTNDKAAKSARSAKSAQSATQGDISSFADMTEVPQTPWNLAATEEAELSAEAKKNRKKAIAEQQRKMKLAKKNNFGYVSAVEETPAAPVAPVAQETLAEASVPSEVDDTIRYISVQEAFVGIDMGAIQSVEDKFAEIAKMDKTQFVVYIARLFSMRGYQVKLTPVMDNRCIDMVVEKSGMYIAVGCVLTDRMLNANDLKGIAEGAKYYPVSNTIALTNTFFDAEAVLFAKDHRISLVDHDVLVSDFMVK